MTVTGGLGVKCLMPHRPSSHQKAHLPRYVVTTIEHHDQMGLNRLDCRIGGARRQSPSHRHSIVSASFRGSEGLFLPIFYTMILLL